ncbi:hypothetical protein JB92DRAFT_1485406 [Gautieria morchelliformis]|nr:hypothetical protein JB92DRAFT_1485406 [Gautieria morchelliformis]
MFFSLGDYAYPSPVYFEVHPSPVPHGVTSVWHPCARGLGEMSTHGRTSVSASYTRQSLASSPLPLNVFSLGDYAYPSPVYLELHPSPVPHGVTSVWHPCARGLGEEVKGRECLRVCIIHPQSLASSPLPLNVFSLDEFIISDGSIHQPHPRPTKSLVRSEHRHTPESPPSACSATRHA